MFDGEELAQKEINLLTGSLDTLVYSVVGS